MALKLKRIKGDLSDLRRKIKSFLLLQIALIFGIITSENSQTMRSHKQDTNQYPILIKDVFHNNFFDSNIKLGISGILSKFDNTTLFLNQFLKSPLHPFLLNTQSTTYRDVPQNPLIYKFPFTEKGSSSINAVNDNFYKINCTFSGVIGNVLSNDLSNNSAVSHNLVTFTLLKGSNSNIFFDNKGNVTVLSGINAGKYTYKYKIHENTNVNNFDTASVTIVVKDVTPPVFNDLPAPTTIDCSADLAFTQALAIDSCSEVNLSYSDSRKSGTCAGSYSITRNWVAKDSSGNKSYASQTINIQDLKEPQLNTSYPTLLNVTCNEIPAVPSLKFTDYCSSESLNIVYGEIASSVANDGTYTITRSWRVNDACGNQNNFTQTINVTISNFSQSMAETSQCNDDISLFLDLNNELDTKFPGVTLPSGSWSITPFTTALNTDNGIFTPLGVPLGDYIVTYSNNDPICPSTVSIKIPVDNTCLVSTCRTLNIHNGVSPNGDGIDDTFIIDNITDSCYTDNTVEIYNRWGVKIFDVEGYDNKTKLFDGESKGKIHGKQSSKLSTGTYFYILKYKNLAGNYTTKTGYLYLIDNEFQKKD